MELMGKHGLPCCYTQVLLVSHTDFDYFLCFPWRAIWKGVLVLFNWVKWITCVWGIRVIIKPWRSRKKDLFWTWRILGIEESNVWDYWRTYIFHESTQLKINIPRLFVVNLKFFGTIWVSKPPNDRGVPDLIM